MGIENLRRWHWCVIGVIAGAIFASVKIWTGVPEPEGSKYYSPVEFEQQLVKLYDPQTRSHVHKLENFVIQAADKIPISGKWVKTEIVTYDAWLIDRPKLLKPGEKPPELKPGEKPPVLATKHPMFLVMQKQLVGDKSIVGDVSKMEVRDYIQKVRDKVAEWKAADAKRYAYLSPIEYKYNWLDSPKGAYTVYGAGGLVVIGLIWPTVLGLLTGMGFGKAPTHKEKFDLSRFKRKKQPEKPKAVVTVEDVDKLKKLEEELEASLKEGAKERVHTEAAPVVVAPVKTLNAGPLETAKGEDKKDALRKGYGADQGDYYPTEVHGKKKP